MHYAATAYGWSRLMAPAGNNHEMEVVEEIPPIVIVQVGGWVYFFRAEDYPGMG